MGLDFTQSVMKPLKNFKKQPDSNSHVIKLTLVTIQRTEL